MHKNFVWDNFSFVQDKKYFVREEGPGINHKNMLGFLNHPMRLVTKWALHWCCLNWSCWPWRPIDHGLDIFFQLYVDKATKKEREKNSLKEGRVSSKVWESTSKVLFQIPHLSFHPLHNVILPSQKIPPNSVFSPYNFILSRCPGGAGKYPRS